MSEVHIIGGSAAGLFAGYLLARAGKTVRLFDTNNVLDTESRTLITTSRLAEVIGFCPDEAICNEIDQIQLFSARRFVTIPLKDPDLVVERSIIIRSLAKMAMGAGVTVHAGCKLLKMDMQREGVSLTFRDTHSGRVEKISSTTVIGADGAFSGVARLATGTSPATTPILQAIVKLPKQYQAKTTQVWFEPKNTPYFYWLIPQSQSRGAVGLIAETGQDLKRNLDRFLLRLNLDADEIQAARVPAYRHWIAPWRRISGADVYLVGDAAAQVKVTTVGGLVTGLRGAKAAANAILRRTEYAAEMALLRQELGLHLMIRSVLNKFETSDYDRLLELLNPKTIHLLGRHNRDRAAMILCKILIAQPKLVSFAAQKLTQFTRNLSSRFNAKRRPVLTDN
jgi:flavin-dependent dehydrogenase